MELVEARNNIKEFFSNSESYCYFNKDSRDKVTSALNLVNFHIDLLTEDKEVAEYDHNLIFDCLQIIKSDVLEKPLSKLFMNFVISTNELIRNWNINLDKHENIDREIDYISRFLSQHFTVMEAISVLKILSSKLKTFESWIPPSYDISKHMISMLNENKE